MRGPGDALRRLLAVLDLLEIPYLVGGSVASSIHGLSRPTMDVDLVVDLNRELIDEFAGQLRMDFYADPQMIREALGANRAFNLIHYRSSYKFDLFPLRPDEYSRTEFSRRIYSEARTFGDEPIECAVATAEDTILRKLQWYRSGGGISERQWNDVRGILQLKKGKLDLDYIRQWAGRLDLEELLKRLLAES